MWEEWPKIIIKQEKIDSQNKWLIFVKISISCSTKFWITRWCDDLLLSKHLKYHPWFYLISSIKVDPFRPLCQHLVSKLVSRFCWINLCRGKSPPTLRKCLSCHLHQVQYKSKFLRKKNLLKWGKFVSTPNKVAEMKRKIQDLYRI